MSYSSLSRLPAKRGHFTPDTGYRGFPNSNEWIVMNCFWSNVSFFPLCCACAQVGKSYNQDFQVLFYPKTSNLEDKHSQNSFGGFSFANYKMVQCWWSFGLTAYRLMSSSAVFSKYWETSGNNLVRPYTAMGVDMKLCFVYVKSQYLAGCRVLIFHARLTNLKVLKWDKGSTAF